MKRSRITSILSALAICLSLIAGSHTSNAADQPNIVFILADDMGCGDFGAAGHPYAVTPNIDRLASEGTLFEQFYATGVTCCPSRTGFMTSRHPASYEKYMTSFGFQDRITVMELLKQKEYRIGHYGKWHIGGKPNVIVGIYGIDEGQIIGNSDTNEDGRDGDLFDASIEFIRRNKDRSFYLNIWGHVSHYKVPNDTFEEAVPPFSVDPKAFNDSHMEDRLKQTEKLGCDINVSMRNYVADLYGLDLNIGKVLDTLDELGLSENTIIIFATDQGPAPNTLSNQRHKTSDHQFSANMLGWAKGYRGGKHTFYQGGVRIPFILRWPGNAPAGKVNVDSRLSALDFLPTLCAITGVDEIPNEIEGRNVVEIWKGSDRTVKRPLFWKLSDSRENPSFKPSILLGKWKYYSGMRKDGPFLYDIEKDPGEFKDIAKRHPEVVKELQGLIDEWNDTLPKVYIKDKKLSADSIRSVFR